MFPRRLLDGPGNEGFALCVSFFIPDQIIVPGLRCDYCNENGLLTFVGARAFLARSNMSCSM